MLAKQEYIKAKAVLFADYEKGYKADKVRVLNGDITVNKFKQNEKKRIKVLIFELEALG